MSRLTSNLRRVIAPLFIAALFALIGTGHDVLLAAHNALSHATTACDSAHGHHHREEQQDHQEQSPESQNPNDCGVCRSLMLAQSIKSISGTEPSFVLFDSRVELNVSTNLRAVSLSLREARARGPPSRRV